MSEDTTTNGTTVTIKYGKGYEETWVSFRGSNEDVRKDIVGYFGLADSASVADLTLSELVVNATNLAHGKGNVAALLGGTVIPSSGTTNDEAQSDTRAAAWAQAEQQASEPAVNPVLAQIEACSTVDELKLLWAENQAAFSDADVEAAYKAKGKALTSA